MRFVLLGAMLLLQACASAPQTIFQGDCRIAREAARRAGEARDNGVSRAEIAARMEARALRDPRTAPYLSDYKYLLDIAYENPKFDLDALERNAINACNSTNQKSNSEPIDKMKRYCADLAAGAPNRVDAYLACLGAGSAAERYLESR